MLRWLRHRSEMARIGRELYERIVAQARSEPFFRDLAVPDTMEGRFEMIVLHLHLVRERLKREGAAGQRLGQIVLEHLISDMDDALRQMGYDMGVPRRVKKATAAFGERSRDYADALRTGDAAGSPPVQDRLESALMKHVYAATNAAAVADRLPHVGELAAYVQRTVRALDGLDGAAILAGTLSFPEPPAGATTTDRDPA